VIHETRRTPTWAAALLLALSACGGLRSAPHLVHAATLEPRVAGGSASQPALPPNPLPIGRDSLRGSAERPVDRRATAAPVSGVERPSPRSPGVDSPVRPGASGAAGRTRTPAQQQGRWIRVSGAQPHVRFSWEAAPLAEVVAVFAEVSGRDIIVARDVQDVVITAAISEQPWHLALESVASAYRLRPVEDLSGIITIVPETRALEAREPVNVTLQHRLARDVAPLLRPVLGADSSSLDAVVIVGNEAVSRELMLFASPEKLAQARDLIAGLDRRPFKVVIEQRIVQVNRSAMQQLGLDYFVGQYRDSSGVLQPGMVVEPRGGLSARTGRAFELLRKAGVLGTLSISGFVDALEEHGFGETETAQSTTVNSDETSEILVGDVLTLRNNQPILVGGGVINGSQPFAGTPTGGGQQTGSQLPGTNVASAGGFTTFESGTRLKVTPYVLSPDEVRLDLHLTRDGGTLSPDGSSISGGRQVAYTRVTVRNGVPIVIGGLTVQARSRSSSGVPLLSRIPVLGRLFRNEGWAENYQDVLIVVTPRIVTNDFEAETP
jgi:type IV pilus assembly protein PilQ